MRQKTEGRRRHILPPPDKDGAGKARQGVNETGQKGKEGQRETRMGGKRNGEEFRGSQTHFTPSTADATFCLAQ